MQKIIELKHITKSFDGGEPVLKDVSLDVYDNEFLTLLGPSGCGKTTILRIIGGFEQPDEGDVLFLGERINDIPAHKRNVNTVFQRYALFPHLNVFENIAFPLREKHVPMDEIEQKVHELLEMVALKGFEHRSVTRLSGGQQQRVAIARALISRPRVLLLDEPLGALDLKLRKDMQQELKNIQKQTGITFIFVTHDQEEALSMSDTIVVMSEGKIHQIGSPTDIYNEPSNAFVADFIGESNIVPAVMLEDYKVRFKGLTFKCVDAGFGKNVEVDVVIRPEDIDIVSPEKARVVGKVVSVVFMGVHYEIDVDCGGYEWVVHSTDYAAVGDTVGISIPPDAIHVMKKTRESNIFDAEVWPSEGMIYIDNVGFAANALEGYENKEIAMVEIAPEKVQIVNPQDAKLTGTIKSCMFLSTHYQITVSCEENDWIAHSEEFMEDGEEVGILVDAQDLILTDKKE